MFHGKALSQFLVFRLPCFLSSLPLALVVVLPFYSYARTPADFSLRGRCVTPPYGNLDWRAPHFTITGGRRSSARPANQPVRTVYTRLQFPGWPTQQRLYGANILIRNASKARRFTTQPSRNASYVLRYKGTEVQDYYYIRRSYQNNDASTPLRFSATTIYRRKDIPTTDATPPTI